MRRLRLYLFIAATALSLAPAAPSLAQYSGHGGPQSNNNGGDDQQEEIAKAKRKQAFGLGPQVQLKNAGPCPYVKVLYDAGRYVEFKDNVEASANVVYSGEIETIGSACAYTGALPIHVDMRILFELGRGPQAREGHKTYRYWVAVTDRNHAVLDKEFFDLPVSFPSGQDRVSTVETLKGITI
ncbi:MAG TPA: Tat pathway signal sequence domain protein, partial [Caulobacteraceae bacterium]